MIGYREYPAASSLELLFEPIHIYSPKIEKWYVEFWQVLEEEEECHAAFTFPVSTCNFLFGMEK